jgi:hypothetical protein
MQTENEKINQIARKYVTSQTAELKKIVAQCIANHEQNLTDIIREMHSDICAELVEHNILGLTNEAIENDDEKAFAVMQELASELLFKVILPESM